MHYIYYLGSYGVLDLKYGVWNIDLQGWIIGSQILRAMPGKDRERFICVSYPEFILSCQVSTRKNSCVHQHQSQGRV